MRVSKENLLDYFGVQFKSYSNQSVEYAQFSFGDNTINWNFGKQFPYALARIFNVIWAKFTSISFYTMLL